jgi:hypothetical protein
MVFGCGGAAGSLALPLAGVLPSLEGPDPVGSEELEFLGLKRGAGKFCFLSTASMSLWNLLKRLSALMRVASRSIVVESSLTKHC